MPERRLRAILFDKDGTLTDFRASWLAKYVGAAEELARRAGAGPELAAELLALTGFDVREGRFSPSSPLLWATGETIAARWGEHPRLRNLGGVEAVVQSHLADDLRYPPKPVGDLEGLFCRLAARGYVLGLATMDRAESARLLAERFGLARHLAFIAGADSGCGHKPEPGMVQAFCRLLGVGPEAVLVVGDSVADLEMARRAGCGAAVAVCTGATPESDLQALADVLLPDVLSLEAWLAAQE